MKSPIKSFRSWLNFLPPHSSSASVGFQDFPKQRNFLVNHPPIVDRILRRDNRKYPKHSLTSWLLRPLIGDASFSVNYSEWSLQRRELSSVVDSISSQNHIPVFVSARDRVFDLLGTSPQANVSVDIARFTTLYAADIMTRVAFSCPISFEECDRVSSLFYQYQSKAGFCLPLAFLGIPLFLLDPFLRSDASKIRQWVDTQINANQPHNSPSSLLGLLNSADFDKVEVLDQLCMLFLAGHETTANSLAFCLYLLAVNPDTQKKVFDEVSAHISPGASLTPLLFDRLSYTKAVYLESLRLFPPLPFLLRESTSEDSLAGLKCPAKSLLTISPWTIHRSPRYWPSPEDFDPTRFIDQSDRHPCSFIPFGYGPRSCPGAQFAIYEALVFLAGFVLRWHATSDPSYVPELSARLTLRSTNGIQIFLSERRR